jgi:hypothetical protein
VCKQGGGILGNCDSPRYMIHHVAGYVTCTCTQPRHKVDIFTVHGGDIYGCLAKLQQCRASLTRRRHVATTEQINYSEKMRNVGIIILGQGNVHLIVIGSAEVLRLTYTRNHAMLTGKHISTM